MKSNFLLYGVWLKKITNDIFSVSSIVKISMTSFIGNNMEIESIKFILKISILFYRGEYNMNVANV